MSPHSGHVCLPHGGNYALVEQSIPLWSGPHNRNPHSEVICLSVIYMNNCSQSEHQCTVQPLSSKHLELESVHILEYNTLTIIASAHNNYFSKLGIRIMLASWREVPYLMYVTTP